MLASKDSPWRRWLLSDSFRIALPIVVIAWLLSYTHLVGRVDHWIYDMLMRAQVQAPADDIVIVSVDGRSLERLGQWPWSRAVHADLVDRLTSIGARAIGFDVAFPEAHAVDPEGDRRFAAAIARSARVVLPIVPERRGPAGGVRAIGPMPELAAGTTRLGHTDVELDDDAVSRRVFLRAGEGSARWPALGLAVASTADPGGWRHVPGLRRPDDSGIPNAWVRDNEVMIGFAGPPGQFRHVSYVDVLNDDAELGRLKNAIVLVGVTATGLRQDVITPVSGRDAMMSGVEFNANVVNALERGALIVPLSYLPRFLVALAVFLVPVFVFTRLGAAGAFAVLVAGLLVLVGASYVALSALRVWFAPALPSAILALGYPLYLLRGLERTSFSLAREKEHSRAVLQSIADAVVTIDRAGFVQQMNSGAEAMSGLASEEAVGLHLLTVFEPVSDNDRALLLEGIAECVKDGERRQPPEHADVRGRHARHSVRLSVSPLGAGHEGSNNLVIVLTDISDTIKMTERMAHLATHDALTGLPNRVLLTDRLTQAILNAKRYEDNVAILFVDLDGFKRINDSLGHSAGDVLLGQVALRLHERCRATDTVARWGGDEFVILLPSVSRPEVALAVGRDLIETMNAPFRVGGQDLHISASVGIAMSPKDGDDVETLLANADVAMYRAKQSGRDAFCFYSETIDSHTRRQLETEGDLRKAIARGELALYLQPQVCLQTRRLVGVEGLARWNHPTLGQLAPAHFIPIAEENGLIVTIGEWALQTACRQLQQWERAGIRDVSLSINVSPRQFLRQDLAALTRELLAETGVDPRNLVFEVTESTVMHDVDRVTGILRALKEVGVKIAIDDFGTGYSSLTYLKRFPIDQLKIDRSFVAEIATDPDAAAIVNGVLALAKSLRIATVAEGIETDTQFALLHQRHCDWGQGYYFGRPTECSDLLRAGVEGRLFTLAPQTVDAATSLLDSPAGSVPESA